MADKKGFNGMSMKAKLGLLALCPLLIIALCAVVILLYAGTLVEEGIYTPPVEEAVWLSVIPETDEEKLQTVNTLLDRAQNSGETQIIGSGSVDFYNLASDLTDSQNALLQFAAGSIEGGIAGFLQTDTLAYGETRPVFTLFENAEITIPETEDGSLVYAVSADNAYIRADEELFATAEQEFESVLTVDAHTVTPTEHQIQLTVDPLTDRLQKVVNTRTYKLGYTVTFTGDLASLGTKAFSFDCTVTQNYDITWAGISVNQEQMILHKNGYEGLATTINKAADSEYTLTFVSSDPSVATVDESGLVEAVSISETPVIITATLAYLGKTYTDTCEVLIINEPESVKMRSGAQTIRVGESVTLSAEVQPANATIKDLLWYSPDESVATVDENGVVTAVGAGTVQIIAISRIGTYMAGCNITVEGGAN